MNALERLREAAMAIYGDDWQSPVARTLGALHPRGPRPALDVRLVQRWRTGNRPVPRWIDGVLPELLHAEAARLRERARALDTLALRLAGIRPRGAEAEADAPARPSAERGKQPTKEISA